MKAKDEIQLNKVLVCEHTGMSEDEYNLFRYELAEKWAEKWIEDRETISFLLADKAFIGLFSRHYARRESLFIENLTYNLQHNEFVLEIHYKNKWETCTEAWQIKQHYFNYMTSRILWVDKCQPMIESLSMLVKHIKQQPVKVLA